MQDLPHVYQVSALAGPEGNVSLSGDGLPVIESAPPQQFGGPGDRWSPEGLLVAAVADCFILSFRAIARASKFDWVSLDCNVEGVLERSEKVTCFTGFTVNAALTVPAGADEARALRLLDKAEHGCLITNSLSATVHLNARLVSAA